MLPRDCPTKKSNKHTHKKPRFIPLKKDGIYSLAPFGLLMSIYFYHGLFHFYSYSHFGQYLLLQMEVRFAGVNDLKERIKSLKDINKSFEKKEVVVFIQFIIYITHYTGR